MIHKIQWGKSEIHTCIFFLCKKHDNSFLYNVKLLPIHVKPIDIPILY